MLLARYNITRMKARTLGRCFLILGNAAIMAIIQAKSGSGPPRTRMATPSTSDEVNPTANLALVDVSVDGNCVTTSRLNDETSITVRLDAAKRTFVRSCKEQTEFN